MFIDISIIIVNWNTRKLLLDCLESVYRTARRLSIEVFVVDNGSSDGSVSAVAEAYPQAVIIANRGNQGFSKANNQALKQMQGRYALLLNSDAILKESALDDLYAFMEANARAGMCAPQLLNSDGSLQESFGVFPTLASEFGARNLMRLFFPELYRPRSPIRAERTKTPIAVDFVMGACVMVRKAALDDVGLLDDDYFFFYEEIDWCYRMNKTGWSVYFLPVVEVTHLKGGSAVTISRRARVESWRSRYTFFIKNLKLSGPSIAGLYASGFLLASFRFVGYTVLNMLALFSRTRLRQRWMMFGYILLWHVRGFPVTMGLPR